MRRTEPRKAFALTLLSSFALMGLVSCSADVEQSGSPDMSGPARVDAVDLSAGGATRAVIGQQLETFSMYSMTAMNRINGSMLSDGILFSKSEGTWTSNAPYYMDERLKMNAYGVSPNVE